MKNLLSALNRVHEDESGHIDVGLASLVAGIGGVVLGVGAASDSDAVAIAGGVVLGLGILVGGFLRHRTIDYDIYARLEKLEKK